MMVSTGTRKEKINLLLSIPFLRFAFHMTLLTMSCAFILAKSYYQGMNIFCRSYRILLANSSGNIKKKPALVRFYDILFDILLEKVCLTGRLYESFKRSHVAKKTIREWSRYKLQDIVRLRYPKNNDSPVRQGNLMILKKYNGSLGIEKGIIILHYSESFSNFAALFDLNEMSKYYRFVLEPSWWGYQNVNILLLWGLKTSVVIESPYGPDFDFIARLGKNFIPIRLGAGDWVDIEKFVYNKSETKTYHIVMVGNWSRIKKHEQLFKAVARMKNPDRIKIALIGYSALGRTKHNILKEAERYGISKNLDIFEKISPTEVASILRKSMVNVLLSEGEGANRGIYEGLFSGNVIVVYKDNRGVNRDIVNGRTGYWAGYQELDIVLEDAIESYPKYNSYDWAIRNTGYKNSSQRLNASIKEIALADMENWTTDIVSKKNVPNNLYANDKDRVDMEDEYRAIEKYLTHRSGKVDCKQN